MAILKSGLKNLLKSVFPAYRVCSSTREMLDGLINENKALREEIIGQKTLLEEYKSDASQLLTGQIALKQQLDHVLSEQEDAKELLNIMGNLLPFSLEKSGNSYQTTKNICFLVPTFPPHYQYAKNLVDSYFKFNFNLQADLFFIFTNEEEKDSFGPWNHTILLPKSLRIFERRGIINIKKFYGLMKLKERYEYIIILDDESVFIKGINLDRICHEFFSKKLLYGNLLKDDAKEYANQIMAACRAFFQNNPDSKQLNDELYLWFNQPCIYKTSTLDKFFKSTKIDKNLRNLTVLDFDYYIYMNYLILHENFHVKDVGIRAFFGALEAVKQEDWSIMNNTYKNVHFLLASKYTYPLLNKADIFFLMQIDR